MTMKLATLACAAAISAVPAAQAQEAPVIKYAMIAGPQSPNFVKFYGPWIQAVNADAGGSIEVKPFFGTTLATFENMYDRLTSGVIEMGTGLQGMIGGQFPATSVADLPIVSEKSRDSAAALWALYDQGLIADEYAKVRPLMLFVYPQISLHFRKPVKTVAELRGLKMSVSDRTASETVSKLGIAPVTMGPQDIYGSLSRGVIDGAAIQWTGILPFKLQEVSSYHVKTRLGSSSGFTMMSKQAHDKLPAQARTAFDKHAGYKASRDFGRVLDEIADEAYALVSGQPGHTMATFTPADEAEMYKRVEPVLSEWVKRTPNGEKILASFKAEVVKSAAMP